MWWLHQWQLGVGFLIGWLVFRQPQFVTNWLTKLWAKLRGK